MFIPCSVQSGRICDTFKSSCDEYSGPLDHHLYTDFYKAFDVLEHNLLILKLNQMGIGGTLINGFNFQS